MLDARGLGQVVSEELGYIALKLRATNLCEAALRFTGDVDDRAANDV